MNIRNSRARGRLVRSRGGFSLLELVSVIWVLTLVLLLGVTTVLGAIKIERSAAAAYERQALRSRLADQFRSDVTLAAAAPDEIDEIKAGAACLILRWADGKHIVYRTEAGRLQRAEIAGAETAPQWAPLGGTFESVEFVRSGADGHFVSMRLREQSGPNARNRWTEISAALGGDLR